MEPTETTKIILGIVVSCVVLIGLLLLFLICYIATNPELDLENEENTRQGNYYDEPGFLDK